MKQPDKARGVTLEGLDAIVALEALDEPALVYVVYGKERHLVDRALGLLRERVIDPRTRDFNYELYQGRDVEAAKVVAAARTLPMMARRRFVMVRDLDGMKADEQAKLLDYLEAPSPETCLVLEATALDQRTRFGQSARKLATCIKLEPLYDRQLPAFVRGEAKRRGVRLEAGAAELLCEEVGSDLGALADTVERLALYAATRGGAVSAADVEAQVPSGRRRTVFELADAIGRGDRPRAFRALASLTESKESGVRMVAMLARHVRQLWTADALVRDRVPRGEMPAALGVPPFFVDGIVAQAKQIGAGGEAAFRSLHDALYRADRALKSSRLDEERLLEGLVLELTARR